MIRRNDYALIGLLSVLLVPVAARGETIVDFETLGATLANDSAYIGADLAGGFSENGAQFNTNYSFFPGFGDVWDANAYANRTSFATGGAGGFDEFVDNNDKAVAPGSGFGGSSTWGVANSFVPNTAVIVAPNGAFFDSMYVTNTRTTKFVIEEGNGFSPIPFGGVSGDVPDLFTVRFNDLSPGGSGFVEFVLADYRFTDNSQDYVVDDWELVDLTPLNEATRIGIEFTSTDVGSNGINTPTYVAFDNIRFETLTAVPEPGVVGGLTLLSGCVWWHRRRKSRRSAVATAQTN